MKNFMSGCVLLVLLKSLIVSAAVTISECDEPDGGLSYRDRCPPGITKSGEKVVRGSAPSKEKTIAEIAEQNPVVLYTVPDCDACDLVRNALNNRGVPVNEKNVADNSANQDEMKAKIGSMTVPGLLIGTTVLTGYSRTAIDNALNQAGFPPPATPAPAAAAPASAAKP